MEGNGGGGGPLPLIGGLKAVEQVAQRMGILCAGCGEPISEEAWEYVLLEPGITEEGIGVNVTTAVVCRADSCAERRNLIESEATARRAFRPWELMRDAPGEPEDG